jgi:hypothetical protein
MKNPTSTAFSYIFEKNRSIVQISLEATLGNWLTIGTNASDETFLSNKMWS